MPHRNGPPEGQVAVDDTAAVRIHVTMPRSLHDWMKYAAYEMGVSQSAFVRVLLGNARRQAQQRRPA